MAKKLICFPFDKNGNMKEYSFINLDDKERERVYQGEKIIDGYGNEWRPNIEIELTLHYKRYGRGRSAVTFYWADEEGHSYPMFVTDMDEILRLNIGCGEIHAVFTYIKRGANYGIKFLRFI